MSHSKKFKDSDNSRSAYRYRVRNNIMTAQDKKRLELNQNTQHGKKLEALIQSGEVRTKIKRGGTKIFNIRKH